MNSFSTDQSASPREAASIAAAIRRFSQDTTVAAPARPIGMDPWLKAALEEGVSAKEPFSPSQPFGTI